MKKLWAWFRKILVWLGLCSPVPKKVLLNPPVIEMAPDGYVKIQSHDFESEVDCPPNNKVDTCACWGVDHVHRRSGGMWNPDGTVVPPNDPRNYFESNPKQVKWVNGFISLITDLNNDSNGCPVVGGSLATLASYSAPVFVAMRVKVAPKGGTYWTSGVSYSPNGWLPETDFFEFECSDSKAYTTSIHRLIDGSPNMIATHKYKFPIDLSEDFHIYAMDMQKDRTVFYLDNVKIWEFEKADLNDEPSYFMLEHQIFKNCNPDLISPENLKKMFPMAAVVDWIRIYKP